VHILTIGYGHPSNPATFDDYYRSTHLPLVQKVPRLVDLTARHCAALDEGKAPYYLVAELAFASHDELIAALQSPEGQATAADAANFADGGVTMFVQHD
jgi:uncharacterized protein (TIGR02118 family)